MIYEPREDSYLLQRHVAELAFGKVLDMGTGSGILAFQAAQNAEMVLAVDINEDAVKSVTRNARNLRIKNLSAVQSNLFSKVKTKFNTIIFNPPYLPSCSGELDAAVEAGPNGWEVIEKFLSKAENYLRKDGIILLLFSSLTNKIMVDDLIRKHRFRAEQIDNLKLDFEELYVYKLYK